MYMQLHRYCYEMIITKSVILLKIYVIKKLGYVSARQGFFMCEPYKVKTSLHYMYIYTLAIFTRQTSFAKGQEILPYDPSLTRKYSTLSLLCVSRI